MPETDPAEALLILTTTDSESHSRKLAELLVAEGLVACVNIIPEIHSVYLWEGKVARETEFLLLCKTRRDRFEEVRSAIRRNHGYDCPEVIALEIDTGDPDYLGWLSARSRGKSDGTPLDG